MSNVFERGRRLLWILLLLLLLFLVLGPKIPVAPVQTLSASARGYLGELYQDVVGDRIDDLKDDISRNPIQESANRREQDYAQAYEAITGEPYQDDDRCLTMFGLIPLNCPDPTGERLIEADVPADFSIEECMEVLGLPANLCRQW
ncbi:MAG: hypothetical protein AAF268_10720 [Cyanobacteria bacterium P01_A01_bin.3]